MTIQLRRERERMLIHITEITSRRYPRLFHIRAPDLARYERRSRPAKVS